MNILIYCPDRHICYDGDTPDLVGVGGGITARVRIGKALARLGHQVSHVGNCPQEAIYDGVEYVPLEAYRGSEVDVAVVTTSGGAYDLSPCASLNMKASITVVWVHGVDQPRGLSEVDYDLVFAVSRFIKGIIVQEWGLTADKVEVTYNGYEPGHFDIEHEIERDKFQLIYSSHPSKGLQAAIGVLQLLRQRDPRFHLEIFGGSELWGGSGGISNLPAGVTFHGMVGQKELARHLQTSGFSIQLQDRLEPGALAIPDAKRAGAVIVASPVGVYSELIENGITGIIIPGNPAEADAISMAAKRIVALVNQERQLGLIAERAAGTAVSTNQTARHWELTFQREIAAPGRPG